MTIEHTINKDTKVKGGIMGKSLKQAAVHRWMTTTHARASMTAACSTLAQCSADSSSMNVSGAHHKEACPARLTKDEADVQAQCSCHI